MGWGSGGYWMLDAGCWILDAGYWILDTGYWMLDAGCWILDAGNGYAVALIWSDRNWKRRSQ